MTRLHPKRDLVVGMLLAGAALALFVAIDDPARDFTSNSATLHDGATDQSLRPREYDRSAGELSDAILRAARRIRNWEYIGTAGLDGRTTIVFERTSRLFRLKDDVILHVEELGDRSRVTGESKSRLEFGDLGQNPRNLRRILAELDAVLVADRELTRAAAEVATR